MVNKADRDGAEQTVRELRAESDAPILTAVAANGTGIPELVDAVDAHHRADTPPRRAARARAQILSLAYSGCAPIRCSTPSPPRWRRARAIPIRLWTN